jgi:hypothetical protein
LDGKITWANGTGHTSMSEVRPKVTLKKKERKKERKREIEEQVRYYTLLH